MSSKLSRLASALLIAWALPALVQAGEIRVVAPSPAGSSWDHLAQTLKTLAAESGGDSLDVVNVPGTGGTVGLVRFLADNDPGLLVTGLTMLDAVLVQRIPISLDRMTPVARLAVEYFAVVVPASSSITSIDDLRAAMWTDATKVTWAGGPSGSIDHVAAALFARAVGIDPIRLNYVPFLATGDAVAALADGKVSAAIVTSSEAAGEVKAGRVRVLGLTSDRSEPEGDAPALAAMGIPLELANWRGIVARPGLSDADQARLASLIAELTARPGWRAMLDRKGWRPGYLPPRAFGEFLRGEQARVKDGLKSVGLLKRPD